MIVQFQKISIPTPRKVIENSEGEGVSKAKMFQRKYEVKLEFPHNTWQELPVNEAWGTVHKEVN